jgi:hypothetical protein
MHYEPVKVADSEAGRQSDIQSKHQSFSHSSNKSASLTGRLGVSKSAREDRQILDFPVGSQPDSPKLLELSRIRLPDLDRKACSSQTTKSFFSLTLYSNKQVSPGRPRMNSNLTFLKASTKWQKKQLELICRWQSLLAWLAVADFSSQGHDLLLRRCLAGNAQLSSALMRG